MRNFLSAALLACGLIATACSGPVSPDSTATTTPRPDKDELHANFEAALARAKETRGGGKPPVWTLRDEDTVIHFFGTVHLLRPDIDWRSDAFENAFAEADTVVFEIDLKSSEGQAALMRDFIGRGMFQDGQTLRGVLPDSVETVVETAFESISVPLDAVNTFEPWLAAVNLSAMKLQADGYDPASGVDTVLESEAREAGKAFAFLEEVSDQADAFDLMAMPSQIDFLYETAVLIDDSPRMLDQLVAEWADGDVAGITTMVASPDAVEFGEEAYEALLVNRNAKWVPKIEAMLGEPGVVFIAVGAGHLAGPDSVIEMLRQKGYEISGP